MEKATRQAILGCYRLPRDVSLKLVELRGIELNGAVEEELLSLPAPKR